MYKSLTGIAAAAMVTVAVMPTAPANAAPIQHAPGIAEQQSNVESVQYRRYRYYGGGPYRYGSYGYGPRRFYGGGPYYYGGGPYGYAAPYPYYRRSYYYGGGPYYGGPAIRVGPLGIGVW